MVLNILGVLQCFVTFKMFSLHQGSGISAQCRNAKVEDLWSLTSFFGYSTQTFVLAVNLLDRFLALIKVDVHAFVIPCRAIFRYYFKLTQSLMLNNNKSTTRFNKTNQIPTKMYCICP